MKIVNYSFHGSQGHATQHCWALKKYLKDLIQREYLDEFILDLEEDREVGEARPRPSTKALTPRHHSGQEDPLQATDFFSPEMILRV